ncbi:MAG: hypothetical protein DHS20C11_21330 [Lysobacteraceae bacterium]|nr:MAG: hypothetical protein DHS20C11_21330 [Xanthomonadaceae bacterium]
MKKALFPISVSNQRYSTDNVVRALLSLSREYDLIVFLVADRLQMYNKATRAGKVGLFGVLQEFADKRTDYLEQRKRWLEKIRDRLGDDVDFEVSMKGIDHFADERAFRILRNLVLLYAADKRFRRDVRKAALDFCSRYEQREMADLGFRLSQGYILEEIAISLRIHIVGGIPDEYYLGQQWGVVLRVYQGEYDVDATVLADSKRSSGEPVNFYSPDHPELSKMRGWIKREFLLPEHETSVPSG